MDENVMFSFEGAIQKDSNSACHYKFNYGMS